MTARTPQRQRLIDLLDPIVSAEGYDLEDVSVTAAGRRSLIRVTVDGDNGIDMDSVATVARAVSDALDDESSGPAAFAGPYVLEVSSPGVDRPLTEPRHWHRAAGRLVTVTLLESGDVLTGRVLSSSPTEGCVVLEVDGVARSHPLTALGPGRIQVEFARATDTDELDADDGTDELDAHPGADRGADPDADDSADGHDDEEEA